MASPWKSETPDLRFPHFVKAPPRGCQSQLSDSCNKKPAENVNQG